MEGPVPRDEGTRRRLSAQRSTDTKPEMALRRLLHGRGMRYRVHHPVPGTRRRMDLAFLGPKVAVFVDGCFWHGCPRHATAPKNNADWWRAKLDANRARDRRVDAHLEEAGWSVIRIWEHEDPDAAADRIESLVTRRRNESGQGSTVR